MFESENRRLERFGLKIPVLIGATERLFENVCLLSRDLSGNGGFVTTREPFPVNAPVKIGLILNLEPAEGAEDGRYALVEVTGTVVRSEDCGMAIGFEQEFKISPIGEI